MLSRIAPALLALSSLPAQATTPIAEVICAPRDEMVLRLTGQYHATLTGMGVRDRDSVMEVWSDAGGRWTLVQRSANGMSCILAMGADWMAIDSAG